MIAQPPGSDLDESPPPPPARSWLDGVEVWALAVTVGAGLTAWAVGGCLRWYDYDEVTRAHSVWLASQGLRPYRDFFECHPPYFVLLAPILKAFPDPVATLRALRVFGSLGNLLFLGGLAALAASTRPEGRRWAWLGLALVATQSAVINFLMEFRIDGWGYALAVWSFYRYGRQQRGLIGIGNWESRPESPPCCFVRN